MTPRGSVDTDAVHRAAAGLGPRAFAELLGRRPAERGRRDEALVACFVHGEKTPSCTVVIKAGRLVWRCHACGLGGDAFSAAAGVWGYDVRRSFPDVARRLADLLGVIATIAGPAPRRRERDPVIGLARAIDAAAERVLAGQPIYPADEATIAEGSPALHVAALRLLAHADRRRAEVDAARGTELERLADAFEAAQRGVSSPTTEAA